MCRTCLLVFMMACQGVLTVPGLCEAIPSLLGLLPTIDLQAIDAMVLESGQTIKQKSEAVHVTELGQKTGLYWKQLTSCKQMDNQEFQSEVRLTDRTLLVHVASCRLQNSSACVAVYKILENEDVCHTLKGGPGFQSLLDGIPLQESFDQSKVELGEGSYGPVRLCSIKTKESTVSFALKKVRIEKFSPSEVYFLHKFSSSSYGIKLFGCQVNSEFVYIAQSRAPFDLGNKLVTQAIRTGLNPRQRLGIFRKLFLLLGQLKSFKIFHGDIKPPNIGMDDKFDPLLLDYDSASPLGGIASSRGSSVYASPKRLKIQKALEEFDVYSMAWVVLVMESPFGEDGVMVYRDRGELKWKAVPYECWEAERSGQCSGIVERVVEGLLEQTWGPIQAEGQLGPLNLTTLLTRILTESWSPTWSEVDEALEAMESTAPAQNIRLI